MNVFELRVAASRVDKLVAVESQLYRLTRQARGRKNFET